MILIITYYEWYQLFSISKNKLKLIRYINQFYNNSSINLFNHQFI
jgi:hypothetical protein